MTNGRLRPLNVLERAVERVVRGIPRGTVLSYSQVALRAGRPGAARAIVRALHQLSKVPWWRVIRADKTLAVEIADRQAPLLEREGIRVEGRRVRLQGRAALSKRKRAGPLAQR